MQMGTGMNTNGNSLHDVFVNELKDLYSAENQLLDALPRMAQAATTQDLKQAFQQHLDTTRKQKQRLDQIFSNISEQPTGKKCFGMEGILREGDEVMNKGYTGATKDAALIAAAQKAEHYEIAGYGTVATFADELGNSQASRLLKETLGEEEDVNKKLTKIAESKVNLKAEH